MPSRLASFYSSRRFAISALGALILAAGLLAPLWQPRSGAMDATRPSMPRTGIVTTVIDSRKSGPVYSVAGDVIPVASGPSLTEALSHVSRLPLARRLALVHAAGRDLATHPLSPDQAAFLRAFVANPVLPEGLRIDQVRALKNDVLNLLCSYPGGEAETASVLRALYYDTTADLGLRDYALQHLASLNERDSRLGWDAHWAALDGPHPGLAATALIHLSISQRSNRLTSDEIARLGLAALGLADDSTVPDPARTTAIQVCGRLGLMDARALAYKIARSDSVGIPLRAAAMATLGDLGVGDPGIRFFLESAASGSERRLRLPAANALARVR